MSRMKSEFRCEKWPAETVITECSEGKRRVAATAVMGQAWAAWTNKCAFRQQELITRVGLAFTLALFVRTARD